MNRRPTRARVRDRWVNADGSPSSEAGKGRRWIVEYYEPGKKRVTRESFGVKAAAETRMTEINRQTENGASPIGLRGDMTFAEWAAEYLTLIGELASNTRESREALLRLHVTPIIGDIRLANLGAADCAQVVKSWNAAPTTREYRLAILNVVLNRAVADRRIAANPASGIRIARTVAKQRGVLTDTEAAAMIAGVPEHYRLFVRLALVSGMRVSELCGLTHGQITRLESGEAIIHVDRQLAGSKARKAGETELFAAVKGSSRSDRLVKIDAETVDMIDAYEAAYGRGRADLVFVGGSRSPIFTQSTANSLMRHHVRPILGERAKAIGGAWHAPRRRFASKLRETYSSADVAAVLGNTTAILERHYNLPTHAALGMDLAGVTGGLGSPRERHLTAVKSA